MDAQALQTLDGTVHTMSKLCECCDGYTGYIAVKQGQACVYCLQCGKWVYNAPRWELAGEQRADPQQWVEKGLVLPDGQNYVYRVWGGYQHAMLCGQQLLYIGVTSRPEIRMREHAGLEGTPPKPWANSVKLVTFESYSSRWQAEIGEARAIQTEKPLHNFHYQLGMPWGCESTHCQVVTINPADGWAQLRQIVDPVAHSAAYEFGDPVIFNFLYWWWLATDLPKIMPGALHGLAGTPGIVDVQGIKPCEIPVPEPMPKHLRSSVTSPQFAPPFPKRETP